MIKCTHNQCGCVGSGSATPKDHPGLNSQQCFHSSTILLDVSQSTPRCYNKNTTTFDNIIQYVLPREISYIAPNHNPWAAHAPHVFAANDAVDCDTTKAHLDPMIEEFSRSIHFPFH